MIAQLSLSSITLATDRCIADQAECFCATTSPHTLQPAWLRSPVRPASPTDRMI